MWLIITCPTMKTTIYKELQRELHISITKEVAWHHDIASICYQETVDLNYEYIMR